MKQQLGFYNAEVVRVIDADTLELIVFLGFNIHLKTMIRMYGVDAYEKNTVEGKAAIEALRQLLPPSTLVFLQTGKNETDKYGRILCDVYHNDILIGEWLVTNGHAREYFGGKRTEWGTTTN